MKGVSDGRESGYKWGGGPLLSWVKEFSRTARSLSVGH